MKSIESETLNACGDGSCTNGLHSAQFMAARDSRNRRVSGLATRNGRFYAVLCVDRGDGRKGVRRFPLADANEEPIRMLAAAKDGLDLLKAKRVEQRLPTAGRKPLFADFAKDYLGMASTRAKKPGTLENETQALSRWTAHLGGFRLDAIKTPIVKSYVEKRQRADGCTLEGKHYKTASVRTVALDLVALRNVLRSAEDTGHLSELPRFPKVGKVAPPRRPLISPAQLDTLLAACRAKKEDGSQCLPALHTDLLLLAEPSRKLVCQNPAPCHWARGLPLGSRSALQASALHSSLQQDSHSHPLNLFQPKQRIRA
jgi:hypothetical protein